MTPEVIRPLLHAIEDDLDPAAGGIGWWKDHLAPVARATQADYLVTSVRGVLTALRAAEHELLRHQRSITADKHWVRQWWDANGLQAVPERDDNAKRRDFDIRGSHEATIYHLAQALDRLAAATSLTAGLSADARRMDWGRIEQEAKRLVRSGATDAAHTLQMRAVERVLDAASHGPKDWLPWLRGTRNTHVHRAVRDEMLVKAGDPDKRTHRIVRTAYRQPEFHSVEAIGASVADPEEVFLIQDSEGLLAGLTSSTESLVRSVITNLEEVWLARRADPELIRQPADAWPERKSEPALAFPGYEPDVQWRRGPMNQHPRDARRWAAAGLSDAARGQWRK